MKSTKLFLSLIVAAGLSPLAQAAESAQLQLRGTVAVNCSISVTPASKASNLNINGGEAGALVGTVVESCNAGNGYLVSVTSSNGGYFTSSATGASPVAYSVNFDNNVGNMSTGVTATRDTPQSSRESNLVVSFQGNSSAAAGEYSDTINITLAAR